MKKNHIVALAFALPILLILILAMTVYLPSLFLSTKYNFVYSTCDADYYYNCDVYLKNRYLIRDGKLVYQPIGGEEDNNRNNIKDVNEEFKPRLFLHDTEKNESREITLAETELLSFSSLITSPDGLTVTSDWDREVEFFPFSGGSSSYERYLSKGRKKHKLQLVSNGNRYYNNFYFVGWVLPGRN